MKSKILLATAFMIGLTFQSCESFLEEELVTDVSAASYYTTAEGFEDAVEATYAAMKSFFGVERGFTMTSFGTDIYTNGADGGHKGINRYDGELSPSESYMRDTWRDFYRGINQANAVINRAQTLEGIDQTTLNQRIAEVRFLRGFYYFTLLRTYGDLHLTLEETEGVEIEANRTPKSEIYTQAIIPDLEAAIATLPDSQTDFGRATKPAAEFLLGLVYLTRSYESFGNQQSDASTAETLFSNVINNYGFALLEDFADLWVLGNEEHSEIVFSMQNAKTQVDTRLDRNGHRGHLYFLMEYDKLPGMTRDVTNGRPWKRFRPTPYFYGLWENGERAIDARYDKSFKHAWLSNSAGNIPTDSEGNPMFTVGDTAVFIPGPGLDKEWGQDRQASARFMVITQDEFTEKLFPTMNKWIDPTRPNRQHTEGQRDYILMRLGDAYLLRAEARLQLNDTQGATEDINTIRTRAAWPGQEAAMMVDASQVDLDFLLEERARELVGEGHRWWDLVRTGKLVERVRLHNPQARDNIQDFHTVRPIPQDQIDRTLGGYPQNPGYPEG